MRERPQGGVRFHPAEHRRLQAAEAEVQRVALHFGEGEPHSRLIPVGRQPVDHRAARISKAQKLGDLVEGLAGRIVTRLAEQTILESFPDLEQVRVAARHYQGRGWELHRRSSPFGFQNDRMDMPLDVVHRDQRQATREAQGLGISESHQERAHQSRPHRGRDGAQVFEFRAGLLEGFPHHRHDGAQVFARRQFRNHATVLAMRAHLRSHHGGKDGLAVFHHGGRGFVAGGFDAKDAHGRLAYPFPPALGGGADSKSFRSASTAAVSTSGPTTFIKCKPRMRTLMARSICVASSNCAAFSIFC